MHFKIANTGSCTGEGEAVTEQEYPEKRMREY